MDKDRRKEQSERARAGNMERFNKNLHGEKGVEGLTGFRGKMFYEAGQPRGRQRVQQPITHIAFFRR